MVVAPAVLVSVVAVVGVTAAAAAVVFVIVVVFIIVVVVCCCSSSISSLDIQAVICIVLSSSVSVTRHQVVKVTRVAKLFHTHLTS